jgi:hypothetical protein
VTETLGRRLWAVAFTGFPYSVFKVGGGLAAWEDIGAPVGLAFVTWGGLDVVLNLLALVAPRRLSFCLLSTLGRLVDGGRSQRRREQLGLAIDTLLSFSIVASMIWLDRVGGLPRLWVDLWEAAVIASVLGGGVQRVWDAWSHEASAPA